MRWWLRLVVTLILSPLLWRLAVAYLSAQQGAAWDDLARQSPAMLASLYITFTVPALVLCGVILTASDFVLRRLGLALLTVLVSPLLTCGVAVLIVDLVREPHVQAAKGAMSLFITYGLVWGLTIREPPISHPSRRETTAAEIDAPPATVTDV